MSYKIIGLSPFLISLILIFSINIIFLNNIFVNNNYSVKVILFY